MKVQLAPSWELTTTHAGSSRGIPVLVNGATGIAYGPADIIQAYPRWGDLSAARVAKRMAPTAQLTEAGRRLLAVFVGA
jgi:hypothetical protein